jgi:tetratricopeptide (TPR) repeat protein
MLGMTCASQAFAAELTQAERALHMGRIDEAVGLLHRELASNPNDAASHNLLCRAFYAEQLPDAAIPECEAAVAHAPASSEYALWLGRAYGMKAEQGGPVTGLTMAKRVRQMFEHAVQLDAANVYAMSDLGEFYVAAPGFLGGGLEKAQKLAAQMQPVSSARSHRLLALIAQKQKDYAAAEREYTAEVEAFRAPETLVDLGHFYAQHQNPDQALATLKICIALDTASDATLVDVASILDMQLLRRYLASPARSDAAPVVKVQVQLGRMLAKSGDRTGAQREFQAAQALAAKYEPARKALEKLTAP